MEANLENRNRGTITWLTGGLAAALIGAGLLAGGAGVEGAFAQATETATGTATTTATQSATATATATMTPATSTATATATTSATASPSATATATRTATPTTVPPTATATTVPATSVPTQGSSAPINLTLSGANEVPPVTSSGTGTFRATASANSLAYTLSASGTGTGITLAHIHSGPAGANGPVVANIYLGGGSGVASLNQSGVITQADLVGPMAGDMAAFMSALRAGTLYVNVHTVSNPGGELRAQFPAPPGPPSTGSGVESAGNDNALLLLAAALIGAGMLAGAGGLVAQRRRANVTR